MPLHVVFPAAGVGKRFGSVMPKQYALLKQRPVMSWTLDVWRRVDAVEHRVIAISADDPFFPEILPSYPELQVVDGGAERNDSVRNALEHLAQQASPDDWVMVHDIARPCVRANDIETLYRYCAEHDVGAILARPLTDTIKQSAGSIVEATLDRSKLWAAQTPQCFRLGQLLDALGAAAQRSIPVTDEASAVEAAGGIVHLVNGSADNIKLTHADDLALAEFYLTQQGM